MQGFKFAPNTKLENVFVAKEPAAVKEPQTQKEKVQKEIGDIKSFFTNPLSIAPKKENPLKKDESSGGPPKKQNNNSSSSSSSSSTKNKELSKITFAERVAKRPEMAQRCVIRKAWYGVPLTELPEIELEAHEKILTLEENNARVAQNKCLAKKKGKILKEGDVGAARVHRAFWKDETYFYVPRAYGLSCFGHPPPENCDATTGLAIDPEKLVFSGKLSESDPPQKQAVDEVLKVFDAVGGAMLVLPCGFGKTVCALYLAYKMGLKTMVLVHNKHFLMQWADRIKRFLPHFKIGYLYGNVYEPEGDIVLCMIQSLTSGISSSSTTNKNKSKKRKREDSFDDDDDEEEEESKESGSGSESNEKEEKEDDDFLFEGGGEKKKTTPLDLKGKYDQSVLDQFGLLIVDEAHHTGAAKFSNAPLLLRTKYVLGLSATPNRKDQMTPLLGWFLGPVAFKAERAVEHVEIHEHFVVHPAPKEYRYANDMCAVADMMNDLIRNERRNQIIVDLVFQKAVKENRHVLVIGERVEDHLFELHRMFLEKLSKCDITHVKTGLFTGKNDAEEREAALTCQVIFASYGLATEGIDIPRLDTLVMASPRKETEQVVGRILRPSEEKAVPQVHDFVDPYSLYMGMHHARHRAYKDWGYTFVRALYYCLLTNQVTDKRIEFPNPEPSVVNWAELRKRKREKEMEKEQEQQIKRQKRESEKLTKQMQKEQEKLEKLEAKKLKQEELKQQKQLEQQKKKQKVV